MTDHAHYEELTALAAGGLLSESERAELSEHLATCETCRQELRTYASLVSVALPLAHDGTAEVESPFASPADGARDRFLERAAQSGAIFSAEVRPGSRRPQSTWPRLAAGIALAAAVLLVAIYVAPLGRSDSSLRDVVSRLEQTNAQLTEQLAARDRDLAAQQVQLGQLRGELAQAAGSAAGLRQSNAQQGLQLGQSVSQSARLLAEVQSRERDLETLQRELERINHMRVTDLAAFDAQGTRLREAFDQLRIATATLEVERQLAATGRDILQLMAAKQLVVIDVRDTDANGRANAPFARVFIAEGRTVRIFAFDMGAGAQAAPRRFQVWGEQLGRPGSVRSLGVLDLDDQTQNRWSLSLQNADLVRGVDSVFVTASARSNAPEGPRLLYAYVGQSQAQ